MHKGSANDRLFPYGLWSLSRGGELLLVVMAWVTKADVLLRASEVSGLFLDFLDCVKCPGAACFCLSVPAPFIQGMQQQLRRALSAEDT